MDKKKLSLKDHEVPSNKVPGPEKAPAKKEGDKKKPEMQMLPKQMVEINGRLTQR